MPVAYTQAQITDNRRKYLAALREGGPRCQGEMFSGKAPCAVCLAARVLLGYADEDDYHAKIFEHPEINVYGDVADALGIGEFDCWSEDDKNVSVDDIWKWNDTRDGLTFAGIAARLAKEWGL